MDIAPPHTVLHQEGNSAQSQYVQESRLVVVFTSLQVLPGCAVFTVM